MRKRANRLPTLVTGFDARLTTALVHGGETAAVRLLNRMQLVRPLEELGFSPRCLGHVQSLIEHGEGVVLITVPRESAKPQRFIRSSML